MFGSEPDLQARALRDSVGDLYETARIVGDLIISGKRIPNIQQLFEEAEARFGGRPDAIVCDRWRVDELKDAFRRSVMAESYFDRSGARLQRWQRRRKGMAAGLCRAQG